MQGRPKRTPIDCPAEHASGSSQQRPRAVLRSSRSSCYALCAGDGRARRRLWLHVDGAWGGSAVFSPRQRALGKLRGVERADSVAVNPHKMLNVP